MTAGTDEDIRPGHLPWTIAFLGLIGGVRYSGFYKSYPRDSAGLRAQMAEQAEALAAGQGGRV